MSAFLQLLDPLRQAASAFFKHDVALRRGEKGVQLVLEAKDSQGRNRRKPEKDERAAKRDAAELALMKEQLDRLLSERPETRRALRALVVVEQALAKKGVRALRKLPLEVLRRALDQLEGLVTNWSPAGLAALRSKMAVTLIERDAMDPEAEADAYRTAAVMDADEEDAAQGPLEEATSEDEALAAAYAALGDFAPSTVEFLPELGSPSARAVTQPAPLDEPLGEIKLRELRP